jgi:hypothetical protein
MTEDKLTIFLEMLFFTPLAMVSFGLAALFLASLRSLLVLAGKAARGALRRWFTNRP